MKKYTIILSFFVFSFSFSNAQTILGIDVSHFQGTINWTQVKTTAAKVYAWCKSTQGISYADPNFTTYMANGNSAGVVMGAYHFADAETNTATAEANYFVSIAGPYIKACYLPPVLDLEDPSSGPALTTYFTSSQLTAWAKTFMDTVKAKTGIAPIIYTSGSIAAYFNSSITAYQLWMADPDGNPSIPPATTGVWSTWAFKQYSWTGAVAGISGNVDLDVFNGDTNAFNSLKGCAPVTVNFKSTITSGCPGMTVNYTDLSTSTGTITGWKWTFTGGTPAASTVQNPSITYNTPGTYNVKEVVYSSAGNDSITKTAYITVAATAFLPLVQGFQSSTFPPPGWVLNLPKPNDSIWRLCTYTGSNSTQCMYFPANCGNISNITGERQQLYTPNYSFASATNPKMWFDVAYEPSSVPTYSDTLVIYYSLDCGSTWTSIYSKGGMTLCTTGGTTKGGVDTSGGHGCFIPPNSKAWRTDSINISALAGKTAVMFSFESRSGWGNIPYIDNINITPKPTSVQNLANSNHVKVYPNPNKGSFNISLSGTVNEKTQVEIYDVMGQQVYIAPINPGITQVNLNDKAAGVYFYRIITETGDKLISEGKLLIR